MELASRAVSQKVIYYFRLHAGRQGVCGVDLDGTSAVLCDSLCARPCAVTEEDFVALLTACAVDVADQVVTLSSEWGVFWQL